jgi:hypothetical protein
MERNADKGSERETKRKVTKRRRRFVHINLGNWSLPLRDTE